MVDAMQIHATKNPLVALFLMDHGWHAVAKDIRGRRLSVTLAKSEEMSIGAALASVPRSAECEALARDASQPEEIHAIS